MKLKLTEKEQYKQTHDYWRKVCLIDDNIRDNVKLAENAFFKFMFEPWSEDIKNEFTLLINQGLNRTPKDRFDPFNIILDAAIHAAAVKQASRIIYDNDNRATIT
jgi:hypothetical protein